jgi:hypothetical protein
MLVFLTGFVNYCPSNLNKYESISVNKYRSIDLYTCTVCKGGGVWGQRREGSLGQKKTPAAKSLYR